MKRILIIEDDEGLRDLLENFLEETGYQVVKAADGLEGMDAIEREQFDLIVVDVMLPYVSGIGLLKIVKKRNPQLPIICITGYGNSPEELAEREHADRVLPKPFDLTDLLAAVQELLPEQAR
ncbi:Response regulator receiver domain-containing protein [Desulfacinum infernum DSM 9756]|jgi:DNA-binding response OmpR family regulator|uniref:Response regulator receiver domain-containing protein n=1 Tax=Desulfacinum infernum DSM 9756 TaxID=1121391 RepID=A0A1M4WZ90_9BACT|nr:response regulator [Desulfacinum infernum]MBC7357427.1 response regulator [Desulfacinum sp.]MBZ4658435.1 response regulator [Desulfacinum sp.]SHE86568.1 Response regulator receiver domain-containing protein [Desulfacinum infernum DSM 9756]